MITLEELLNRYQAGERNFSQIQIRLGELVNKNLLGIELNSARLDRISLVDCNLSKANFTRADVAGSNLEGANLSDANFSHANFCIGSEQDYSQIRENIMAGWNRMLDNLPPDAVTQAKEQMSAQSEQLHLFLFPVSLKRANLERTNVAIILCAITIIV